jgi:curved DNA-binding protein CbpA
MNRSSGDPYEILGVARDASEKEIRKRYRKLCKRYHPDLNHDDPQAAEIFRKVKWAYEIVSGGMRRGSLEQAASADFSRADADEESPRPFFGFFHAVRAYCMRKRPQQDS